MLLYVDRGEALECNSRGGLFYSVHETCRNECGDDRAGFPNAQVLTNLVHTQKVGIKYKKPLSRKEHRFAVIISVDHPKVRFLPPQPATRSTKDSGCLFSFESKVSWLSAER